MKRNKTRGNGQGTVYKVGDTYRAQVTRYDTGQRLTASKSGFRTKREALAWCAANRDKASADAFKTFSDVWKEWSGMHLPTISQKKAADYTRVYDGSEELYGRRFSELRTVDFQRIADRKGTYYSRKLYKSVYSMMSDYAVRNGYADSNYAELIELPPMTKPIKRPFTQGEISLLWSRYEEQQDLFSGAALIMIYTGMRYGEISTIEPADIHLDDGYLTGGIKTDAGRAGEILILPRIRPIVESILLPRNQVAAYTAEGFRKGYNRMQEEIGIERHTVHECRHTTATLLAAEGVHPAVISAIMRHTSYTQTMEYTHISREEKQRNLGKILV